MPGNSTNPKSSAPDELNNILDDASASSSDDEGYVGSGSDEESPRTGSIARLDPFYNDREKRRALINAVSKMSAGARRNFMMEPVPTGIWLECYIDRILLGLTRFNRKFCFHLEGGVNLAVVEKQRRNTTAHYVVSTDPMDVDRDNDFCVGKIRANFIGSEFHAYDTGLNPKSLNKGKSSTNGKALLDEVREELMALNYDHGLFNKKKSGPRGLHVVLPHVRETSSGKLERIPCKPIAPNSDGLQALKDHWSQSTVPYGQEPLVRTYDSKIAVWNKRMKSYVLNFNNRVKQASVKNFQLVASDDANEVVMQFGRSGEKNRFNLDFRYPMSPFQALSIAVSTMDYKICSE